MSEKARTQRPDARSDAGFTLVEVLAAVALLSLLSALLLGTLRFGLKAWERAETHPDRVDHVALAQAFLRRLIEDAYPYFAATEPTRGQVAFEGMAATLRLLASAPQALHSGGRARIALSVERRGEHLDLVVSATPELASGAGSAAKKALLPKVQSVELSYFGKGRADRAPAWRQRWVGERAHPLLVRIRVRFADGDRRLWPELVVAPRIAVDVGCVYDPLTMQCRGR